jgi:hypothetical protein
MTQPWYEVEMQLVIPDALRHLDQVLDDPLNQALDAIAEGIVALYKSNITSVGAVLTGRFRDTVHVRSATRAGDLKERIVASDAPYSGVVEYGWLDRARGQSSYPGRFPAQATVQQAGPVINLAIDNQLMRVGFGRGLA